MAVYLTKVTKKIGSKTAIKVGLTQQFAIIANNSPDNHHGYR